MGSLTILFVLTLCTLAHCYPPCPFCPPCPPAPSAPATIRKPPEIIWTGDACGCSSTLPYHVEVPKPVELVIPKKDLGYQIAYMPEPVDCKRYVLDYEVEVPVVPPTPVKLRDCGYVLDVPPPPPPERRYRFDYEVEVPCECKCKPHFLDLSGHVDRIVLPKPDCCIVAEGDCPCKKYKPNIEPLVDCLPPLLPPKPPKKPKKNKRIECYCEEVDYPRYESCRNKRSCNPIESDSNKDSEEKPSQPSNKDSKEELSVVLVDTDIVENKECNCSKDKYIYSKSSWKYYIPENAENLDDEKSRIVFDYLGHKYIEKDGRLQIIKPSFYLEEEVIAEVIVEPDKVTVNCSKTIADKPGTKTTPKTKDADIMDDLGKNLGSLLSFFVQDKHTDLADALGDVLMGMAELEDMQNTLQDDLIVKKESLKQKPAVKKVPAQLDKIQHTKNMKIPSTHPDAINNLVPVDKRLPVANDNMFVPIPLKQNEYQMKLTDAPKTIAPFQEDTNFILSKNKIVNNKDYLNHDANEGVKINNVNSPPQTNNFQNTMIETPRVHLPFNEITPETPFMPLNKNTVPINKEFLPYSKKADLNQNVHDASKLHMPFNELTPENPFMVLSKNILPNNKEILPHGKNADFNMKGMNIGLLQPNEIQNVQFVPADFRLPPLRPPSNNFIPYYHQQQQNNYLPSNIPTNIAEQ